MLVTIRTFEVEHVKGPPGLRTRRAARSALPFSSSGKWWNMNDENTRSKLASGYGREV
jgi:hypothetical protein